jgi:hypothetical protein
MLSACNAIFGRWGLSTEECRILLGRPSPSDLQEWRDGEASKMPCGTTRRLGHILAIHKALRVMFSDPARISGWVRRPNAVFGGRSALALMLAEPEAGLAQVRSYLEAECGA